MHRLFIASMYDMFRFWRYSASNRDACALTGQSAHIVVACHQIEKGLSMANPRPGFGKGVIDGLLSAMAVLVRQHGWVQAARMGLKVLREYVVFNEEVGLDMQQLRACIQSVAGSEELQHELVDVLGGGARFVCRSELEKQKTEGFAALCASRFSIRQFTGQSVDRSVIAEAVGVALKTPSVCNRQAWRVHGFDEPGVMKSLLTMQGGSRGFGDQAGSVLLVSCDLACFAGVGERHQAWVDGGMFSMTLCLALHAIGLGSCCLAWSKEPEQDGALQRLAGLAPSEQPIMMIAVGHMPETFKVAVSARFPLEEILHFH
jgi:nitroreductase